MNKLFLIFLMLISFLSLSQVNKKPQLSIFLEKKISNENSLKQIYDSLDIKSKYEKKYSINIFYSGESEIRADYFKKKGINLEFLSNTCNFCETITKNNFLKQNSFKFGNTKINCLQKNFFQDDVKNINEILKNNNQSTSNIIFYFPIEQIDVSFKKVPTEVKKSPLLEFEIDLNSNYPINANTWIEYFDGELWNELEKNTMFLKPGVNKFSKEITMDSIRIVIEYQNDIDSTCIKTKYTDIIRYNFKKEVKPFCLTEKTESKYYYYELESDEVECGAEKLILLNGLTDNYEFLVKKQSGISKYFAVFEDLCDPNENPSEIELIVDESFNDENYIVLYIPVNELYEKNLFERIIKNNDELNIYSKELLMTIKFIIDPKQAVIKNINFCKEKISWQRCGGN